MKLCNPVSYVGLVLALFSSPSYASLTDGRISYVQVKSGGVVIVYVTGTRTGTSPTCATDQTRYAFNSTTTDGQAKLAAVLTAQARAAEVGIWGSPSCATWSDTEEFDTI